MATSRECIGAYTAPTGMGYPPFISVNRIDGGLVEIIVRGEPTMALHLIEGPQVSVTIPAEEWERIRAGS